MYTESIILKGDKINITIARRFDIEFAGGLTCDDSGRTLHKL